jgi:sugar/nucleoside kinase (ribokinase family)
LHADGVSVDLVEVLPNRSSGMGFVMYERDGSKNFIFHWDGTQAVMALTPNRRGPRFYYRCSILLPGEKEVTSLSGEQNLEKRR